jgi:adenylate cyclase
MLDYCNAGQENPWRRNASSGTVTRLADGGGPPLCVVDGFAYRSMRVRLQPGDLVCVVSDGVTEANDAGGAMYGAPRVATVLARVTTAALAIAAIRDDVGRFAEGAAPSDDRTVLALQWRGP